VTPDSMGSGIGALLAAGRVRVGTGEHRSAPGRARIGQDDDRGRRRGKVVCGWRARARDAA